MGVVDMLMGLAMNKAGTIAKVTGKSAEEVTGALSQAKKMLPDLLANANTPEAGAKILQNMGINKSFINDTFNKYSKYASKIPGMNESKAKNMLNMLTGAMNNNPSTPTQTKSEQKQSLFNKNKYPKV